MSIRFLTPSFRANQPAAETTGIQEGMVISIPAFAGMTVRESKGLPDCNSDRCYFLIISLRSLLTGSWLLRSGVSMMMYFIFATLR
jgi:hypothetical protein